MINSLQSCLGLIGQGDDLTDPTLWQMVGNGALWVAGILLAIILFGLVVAIFVYGKLWFQAFM